ncbi:RHS repeat-associated core domain-containing protein [Pseudomonas syringae group genomosp. 3]|nr:RHS repeat-associated core domain-containing protein [Pseudomonas syringae group genomosp. 3]
MSSANPVVLCTYHYDATDRLADCSPAEQDSTRLFYQKSRLATQTQGQIQHTLLRTDEYLLARLSVENNQSNCALLATDQQQSVIAAQSLAFAYTPYGHRQPSTGPMNLPGFTGERVDPVTGHYLLGNGYRAFNPVLMRFNSPDSLSPFGEGGLNAYGYCAGDPVNRVDPSGHMLKSFRRIFNKKSDDQKLLIARSTVPDPTSYSIDNPAVSSMPTQATNSRASGVGTHVSNTTAKLNVDASPPLPGRGQPPNLDPPPRPVKGVPSSHVQKNAPPKQWYVRLEGKEVGFSEALRRRNAWGQSRESYISQGKSVPFAMKESHKFYEGLVNYLRSDNKERPVGMPTRFLR